MLRVAADPRNRTITERMARLGPVDDTVMQYAKYHNQNQTAYNAAVRAARQAGEPWQGLWDRLSSGMIYGAGGGLTIYEQTPKGRQRLLDSVVYHAMVGAIAYKKGEKGNAYTDYLRSAYGSNDILVR